MGLCLLVFTQLSLKAKPPESKTSGTKTDVLHHGRHGVWREIASFGLIFNNLCNVKIDTLMWNNADYGLWSMIK